MRKFAVLVLAIALIVSSQSMLTSKLTRVLGSSAESGSFSDLVAGLLGNVRDLPPNQYRYNSIDDQGCSLDTIKIIENPEGGYLGVYHSRVGGISSEYFQIRLAHSSDLLNWTFNRTIELQASQPTIALAPNGAYIVAFEKHIFIGTKEERRLGFYYFPNLTSLLTNSSSYKFIAPLTVAVQLEGTPNIYNITIENDVMNVCVGFHYNDASGLDRVAVGHLTVPLANPQNMTWNRTMPQYDYNQKLLETDPDIKGHIGDRDYGQIFGRNFSLQEAQYVKDDDSTWRIFLYDHSSNTFHKLNITTHKGSTSFANPTFTVLKSPNGRNSIVVTYFLHTYKGAAQPGEGGELIFYKEFIVVPVDYPTIQKTINAASPGSVIYILSGTYYEHVIMNKPVSIIGQDSETTIIDGGKIGKVVEIIADGVNIFGLTIRNGGSDYWREEGGIVLDSVRFCRLGNNLVMNNEFGILLKNSSNNILAGNMVINNTYGIVVGVGAAVIGISKDNLLIGNTAKYNFIGIELNYNSYNNTLKRNVMTSNVYNFNVLGERFSDFIQNIDTSNKVENKSILYLIDKENLVISLRDYKDIGYLGLVNCKNITVENLFLEGNWEGMLLAYSQSSHIKNVTVANNFNGIRLIYSYNNILASNTILNNSLGIYLQKSDNNTLTGNLIEFKSSTAPSNKVGSNYTSNVVAVRVGVAGIWITSSNNNTISGNLVRNSKDIGILLYNSTKNHIVANLISNSGSCSLYLSLSNENNIFHNNLINNPQQVYIENSTNMWDDGYPSGGNYWSDYRGVDLYSGLYENETGNDGLGDMPYVIDANNIDKYPLTAPFKVFEAGVWNGKAYNVDVISNSTVSGFKFDVDNKSVSFNVAGDNGTVGFCRVAIPKSLLWVDDGWIIFVDNQPITDYAEFEDENFTYLYFIYTHSTKTVRIKGTHVIPEYTSTITLIMLMLITIAPVVLTNMRIKSFPDSLNSRRHCQLYGVYLYRKKEELFDSLSSAQQFRLKLSGSYSSCLIASQSKTPKMKLKLKINVNGISRLNSQVAYAYASPK